VLNEVISVLARRVRERKRPEQLDTLLDRLTRLVPVGDITWISGEARRLYDQVVGLVRSSEGELNFHDALIALVCREQGISVLIGFDKDFDKVDWLTRAGNVEEIKKALSSII
jgi:predicted nucleic acid-binding protein